jgi:hypothetical protein
MACRGGVGSIGNIGGFISPLTRIYDDVVIWPTGKFVSAASGALAMLLNSGLVQP